MAIRIPRLRKGELHDEAWRQDSAVAISHDSHTKLKALAKESGMSMKKIMDLLIAQAEVDPESGDRKKR